MRKNSWPAAARWTRRKAAAGALATGVASVVSAGLTAPAASGQATAPEAVFRCEGVSGTYADIHHFPADETFNWMIVLHDEAGDFLYDGSSTTDAQGSAFIGGHNAFPAGYRPNILFVAYRDTNGNSKWDLGVDDTVYRGSGTITTCPQTLKLSPK